QRAVLFHTCLHACGLFYNQREQRSVTRARSTNTQRHIKPIAPLPPSLFSSSVFACPRVGPVLLNMLGERDSVCVCVCVCVLGEGAGARGTSRDLKSSHVKQASQKRISPLGLNPSSHTPSSIHPFFLFTLCLFLPPSLSLSLSL